MKKTLATYDSLKAIMQAGLTTFQGLKFTEEINFGEDHELLQGIFFNSCTFSSTIIFSKTVFSGKIHFKNCKFDGKVIFNKCSSNSPGNNPGRILFSNCKLLESLSFANNENHCDIRISDDSVIDRILFNNMLINNLDIENAKIQSISAISTHVKYKTRIKDCLLNEDFIVSKSELGLALDKCKINYLAIEETTLHNILTKQTTFNERVEISGSMISEEMKLESSLFSNGITIDCYTTKKIASSNIAFLLISNCDFQGSFTINGNIDNQKQSLIEHLVIDCSEKQKGLLTFNKCDIGIVNLSGLNIGGKIMFLHCAVVILKIIDFTNKGTLSLISTNAIPKSDSTIDISRSFMGNFYISNCELNSFKQINIYDTDISELRTAAIKWPSIGIINVPNDKKLKKSKIFAKAQADYPDQLRAKFNKDLFRQLKYAMEKQGDIFSSLLFRKLEMGAYYKEVSLRKGFFRSLGDRLILFFSKSNNFGQSWLKPIAILLVTTLFVYPILAIESSPHLTFVYDPSQLTSTFDYLNKQLYNYFLLLNPLRGLQDLFKGSQKSALFYLIEFLHRISVSFLTFQIISAFRKFIR